MSKLPDFEGNPVVRSAVKLTRAGDGLSEALKVEPVVLRRRDPVFFVIRGEVDQVTFKPLDKDAGYDQVRVHTVVTQEIVLVEEAEVADLLDRESARIRRLRDDQAGVDQLPFDDVEDTPIVEDVPFTSEAISAAGAKARIDEATDVAAVHAIIDAEQQGKNRATVLAAAERRLRLLGGEG